MKHTKRIVIALVLAALSLPALADNQLIDSLIGAAVGGGGARALCRHCNTRNRNVATAVGALGGAWVGSSVGDSTNARFNPQQQYYAPQTYAMQETAYRSEPVRTMSWVPQQASPSVWEDQPQPRRPARVVVSRNGDCDEEYYHGRYDPEMARAYCEGRYSRERRVREAYEEGLSGQ